MGNTVSDPLIALVMLAAATGLIHTLAGPDHYLPFVVMSRARGWSWSKTGLITVVCGLGHVLGSVVLGSIGIGAGIAISSIESLESARSSVAAWLMIAFGLVYAAWGLRHLVRNRPHTHRHVHGNGEVHTHRHTHSDQHVHVHTESGSMRSLTPWILFTVFVFGPCEVLIPLLMFPAAQESLMGVVLVTTVFGAATIATMLTVVLALRFGFQAVRLNWLERNTHAVAGFTITLCGVLILVGF
jgi:sulfite exporter TauE/SafE